MKLKNSAMLKQDYIPMASPQTGLYPLTSQRWNLGGFMIFGKKFCILFQSSHSKHLQVGSKYDYFLNVPQGMCSPGVSDRDSLPQGGICKVGREGLPQSTSWPLHSLLS